MKKLLALSILTLVLSAFFLIQKVSAQTTPALCGTESTLGMVSYWKGDGDILDSYGINNGISSNGSYVAGKVGQAFGLVGNQYVEVPDNTSLHIPQNMTLEAWVYPTTSSGDRIIMSKGNSGIGDGWHMMLRNGNHLSFHARYNGGWIILETFTGFNANEWHHVVATYDGSYVRFYIDGNLSMAYQNAAGLIQQNSWPLKIGTVAQGGAYFLGSIDEAAIYNRVLSQTEIAEHYNAGLVGNSYCLSQTEPPVCSPPAPVIANRYLKELGLKAGSKQYKNIVSLVAHQMGPETDFNGVSVNDPAYPSLVKDFVDTNMSILK